MWKIQSQGIKMVIDIDKINKLVETYVIDNMGYQFNENDMIDEIYTGAFSPVNPNGAGAFIGVDWITKQGLEVLAPQHFMKQQVIN